MRRQRVLRASSAQSLCIFCACRLGIESPAAATSQLQRRQISNTRSHFQSTTAAATATATDSKNGAIESKNGSGGLPPWYDPNSALSMSEQQEKESRRQVRAQYEIQRNQAVQEAIWREEEQRHKQNAEELARKKVEQQQARGRGSEGERPGPNTSFFRRIPQRADGGGNQEVGQHFPAQGMSLEAAMRSRQGDHRRESRQRGQDRKEDDKQVFSKPSTLRIIRKPNWRAASESQHQQSTAASASQSRGERRQEQHQVPKISNPFASGSQRNDNGTGGVSTGWGSAATETKPLEYSDAPPPTRFGVSEPTGVAPPPNSNIEESKVSPRVRQAPSGNQSGPRDRRPRRQREVQHTKPKEAQLRAQQAAYDQAAHSLGRQQTDEATYSAQAENTPHDAERSIPSPPQFQEAPQMQTRNEQNGETNNGNAIPQGLADQHMTFDNAIEEEAHGMMSARKLRDAPRSRPEAAKQPTKPSEHQSDPGPLPSDAASISYRVDAPAVNNGSFGYFEEDYESANPSRPQPPPKQIHEKETVPDQAAQLPSHSTPAPSMPSFGSYEADSHQRDGTFDRKAPPTQTRGSPHSPLANPSLGIATGSPRGSFEQQGLGRSQLTRPPPRQENSDSHLLGQQYDRQPPQVERQVSQFQQPVQAWGQTQHQAPPQPAESGWSMSPGQRQQQPFNPKPASAQSSPMTLGQQYGHLPGCPCNLCSPEPPTSRTDNVSPPYSRETHTRTQSIENSLRDTAPTAQPSRTSGTGSYQDHPPQREWYADTGYRAVPFKSDEIQSSYSSSGVGESHDWQHLRRRNPEPSPPPAENPSPPQTHSRQHQQPRDDYLDENWVERAFQNHVRERETRQQQAWQRPSGQRQQPARESDEARYSRSLFMPDDASVATKKCARCGEIGHVARMCNKPKCLACGDIGHIAKDCTQQPGRRRPVRSIFSQVRNQFDGPQSGERQTREPWDQQRTDHAGVQRFDPFSFQADRFTERSPAQDSHRGGRGREAQPGWRAQIPEAAIQVVEDTQLDTREAKEKLARRSRWEDAEVEEIPKSTERGRKSQRGGRRAFDEDEDEEEGARDAFRARKAKRQAVKELQKEKERRVAKREREAKKSEGTTPITLPEFTSVQHLSQLLGVRYEQFVERLEELGYDDIFPGKTLNSEIASLIAMEYNFEPTFDAGIREAEERDLKPQPEAFDKELLPTRPPVVTIMGHVDHGKTTILDYLRKSSVAAGEAGGITQHIGAFSVPLASSGRTITFLDTPGHAAFLAMRQRGANVTDIVILVVAADDSVKPQTLEAIKHAKAAGVPMIVAVNKVDKEEADVQRVKQDLARHGVEIEDFGGETQVVEVSGKTGHGMDELEETVVALSEILDHRAETDGAVEGWILEATTKKAGRVATVLVRRGTLKTGAVMVAGKTWARVRTLKNEAGKMIHEVGPGMPVEVDGWKDQPMAGDEVLQAPTEQKATSVVEYRLEVEERQKIAEDTDAINEARRLAQERQAREKAAAAAAKQAQRAANADGGAAASPEPDETVAQEEQSGQMVVPFVIKADVSGSAEAVSAYIMSVSNPLIAPSILQSGVGAIHESDIEFANAAGGHIIAFNLPTDADMNGLAESRGVKVLENNIIYRVLDDVKAVLEEKLPPIINQRVLGEAEVSAAFEITIAGRKKMKIAGCKVRNGVIGMRAKARVMRGGEKVYDGTITSLKNVKKDVQEMRKGTECGMGFDDWEGFEVGDQIQTYEEISEKRKL